LGEQEIAEFPEEVVKKAFGAADFRCEYVTVEHGHNWGMCMRVLDCKERGKAIEKGWEARFAVQKKAENLHRKTVKYSVGSVTAKRSKLNNFCPLFCLNQVRLDIL
jgi:hypothetical protein